VRWLTFAGPTSRAANADRPARLLEVDRGAKDLGARVRIQLKQRPSIGVAAVGLTGLAVASAVGVGEIAIGMIAGYAAYQVLREGVAPGEAARKIIEEIAKLG
jgi:hypothetical protein